MTPLEALQRIDSAADGGLGGHDYVEWYAIVCDALLGVGMMQDQITELEAKCRRYEEAMDRIRLEDLSAFDCKIICAKAQGLIP